MKSLSKKQFISLIIGITFLIILVFGATYAWFSSGIDNQNIVVGSYSSNYSSSISVVTDGDIEFTISPEDYVNMVPGDSMSEQSQMIVDFYNYDNPSATCSFNIDMVFNGSVPYTKTSSLNGNFEFSISVLKDGNSYFSETNIDDLNWNNNRVALLDNETVVNGSTGYEFIFSFYKLPSSQFSLSAKTYSFTFEVSNVNCE